MAVKEMDVGRTLGLQRAFISEAQQVRAAWGAVILQASVVALGMLTTVGNGISCQRRSGHWPGTGRLAHCL